MHPKSAEQDLASQGPIDQPTPFNRKEWDIVIEPPGNSFRLNLREIWRYRDLIVLLFKRDFFTLYKQTVLGPIWNLVQPSVTALTYYVVFGRIVNISTDGLPPLVFYMAGIVVWSYFSSCMVNNSDLFSKQSALFSKVYFPRLVVPIATAMGGLIAFSIQFVLLMCVSIVMQLAGANLSINWAAISLIPFLALYVGILGMGVGLMVSALTVRFKDLAFAVGFAAQLWMYASPIIYPISQISERFRGVFYLNPMTAPIETMRHVLFNGGTLMPFIWVSNLLMAALIVFAGVYLFSRAESRAMDTV